MAKESLDFTQAFNQEADYQETLENLSLKVFTKAESLLGDNQIGFTSHTRFKVIRREFIEQMDDSKELWSAFLNSLVAKWEIGGDENFINLSIKKDEKNSNKIHISLLDLDVNITKFIINNQDSSVEFTAEPERNWGSADQGGILADFKLIPSSHQLKVADVFLNAFAELSGKSVE